LFPDKPEKFWTSSKQIVTHGHNVRPGQAFTSQKLKFTGHLPDDRLLFADLEGKKKMKNRMDSSFVSVTLEVYEWF